MNPLIAGCLLWVLGVVPETHSDLVPGSDRPGSDRPSYGWLPLIEAAPVLATVVGTVRDEKGQPLTGAVVALLEPHSRGRELQRVTTDLKGRFTAAVAPGAYRLRATAVGFSAMLTRISLDRADRLTYDIALRRSSTLVQRRGDSEDYRWIARSAPRQVLNLRPDQDTAQPVGLEQLEDEAYSASFERRPLTFHGITQFLASHSAFSGIGPDFFGLNFAVSGSLDGNVEMALIGQRGTGQVAPQRLTAIASLRTSDQHKVTASIGYGQSVLGSPRSLSKDIYQSVGYGASRHVRSDRQDVLTGSGSSFSLLRQPAGPTLLEQLSVTSMGEWQVSPGLLLVYGVDYSGFIGSSFRKQDSILPRFAASYMPRAKLRVNASVTPGRLRNRLAIEEFRTEDIQANFELATSEVSTTGTPQLDRSQRYEVGVEKILADGQSAIEAAAFYDLVSGHGVGVMALPLAVSPQMELAFQRIAHQVTAMNGAARGGRLLFRRHLGNRVTATLGYSAGGGTQIRSGFVDKLTPGNLFRSGMFQVATGGVDLDLSDLSGTRVSTVVRLSPSTIVFAIDPYAGRMGVYDPNINIYVTQELPSFGLPVQWQAIVDLRNLLNQTTSVDDGTIQLLATRTSRTIRGGLAFRW